MPDLEPTLAAVGIFRLLPATLLRARDRGRLGHGLRARVAGLEADAWPVTTTPLEVAVRGLAMLAFEGVRLPAWLRDRLGSAPAAGVTIFRYANVEAPAQLRELTDALQAAAPASGPPLLIAADQEGGQLLGLGTGSTPFAGNMALGAAGDPALTERVARAIGTECRALGVNVDYAPVCDLATNPANPGLGVRAFGSEPARVAEHAAAFVRGLQAAGVAATLKHFPGKGEAAVDTHHELGLVTHDRARFETVELVPFRAALAAGARVVMSGHFAAPGLSGVPGLPGTLSREVMDRLLRAELGFQGVAISDALDMKALAQGPLQVLDVLAGLRAGLDVLLCTPDLAAQTQVEEGFVHAVRRQLLEEAGLRTSLARVAALRGWLAGAGAQPDLEAVGCAAHRALAREVAARSITLVRDDAALLPLQLTEAQRIAVIMPRPRDLTPADTSVFEAPRLAAAIRAHHPRVDEFVTGQPPTDEEVAALREQAAGYDLLVVGTISASLDPAQADLVHQLLASGVPLITVALRTPFDLMAYPEARTHLCSYSLLGPSLEALADALWGRLPLAGHLPAAIPGLYPVGHGEERPWA